MKLAALQMDIAWEEPPVNLDRATALLREAAAAGAELAVLPEMFATGFSMDAQATLAAAGSSEAALAATAREQGLWICAGLVLAGRRRPRNSAVVLDPAGRRRLRYDKLQPFALAGEDAAYEAGRRLPGLRIGGLRVRPLICYDLRFPELFRITAENTDLYLVLASWPAARSGHWRSLLQARAIENQAYVLGVNRVGEGDGQIYGGGSCLIGPDGAFLFEAPDAQGCWLAEVDAAVVAEHRRRLPFLRDRRPLAVAGLRPGRSPVPLRPRPPG